MSVQEKEYKSLFGQDVKDLYNIAKTGRLRTSKIRSVCWRVFLGVFPRGGAGVKEWLESQHQRRSEYETYCERFLVDPREKSDGADLLVNNPLAQTQDSVWTKFFELQQLQKDIMKDLERLNPDDEYYRQDDVQRHMLRVLTVWACLHPVLSYRQGMHELLAPMIKVLEGDYSAREADKMPHKGGEGQALVELLQRKYMEHDAFLMFSALMDIIGDAFAPPTPAVKGGPPPKPSGVLLRCNRVHQTLLRTSDQALYQHLESLGVEPQLYGMRWIRLLLGREFHIEDVLVLWDALFADHHERYLVKHDEAAGLELVEYLCVAMLMYVRADLLAKDNMGCLRRLMKYPPVENVSLLVTRACSLRDPTAPPPMPQTPTVSEPSTPSYLHTPAQKPPSTSTHVQQTQNTPALDKAREDKGPRHGLHGGMKHLAKWAAAVRGAADVLADLLPGASDPRYARASDALQNLEAICQELRGEESEETPPQSSPQRLGQDVPLPTPVALARVVSAVRADEEQQQQQQQQEPEFPNNVHVPVASRQDGAQVRPTHTSVDLGETDSFAMASSRGTHVQNDKVAAKEASLPDKDGGNAHLQGGNPLGGSKDSDNDDGGGEGIKLAAWVNVGNKLDVQDVKSKEDVRTSASTAERESREKEAEEKSRRRKAVLGALLNEPPQSPSKPPPKSDFGDDLGHEKGEHLFNGKSIKKKTNEESLFGDTDVSSWLTPKR